jgi:hypothetical protein
MTRDPNRPSHDQEPAIDEPQLGALVREVTDDWQMPPQRLDATTWRDRVGERRGGNGRGPVVRVAVPFLTAIAATVVVAFAAVWLTTRTPNVGKVPPPVSSATTTASGVPSTAPSRTAGAPAGTALPKLFMPGSRPTPSRLLVVGGPTAAVADLTTGTIVPTGLGDHSGPITIVPHDGRWLCVCMDWGPMVGDHPDGVDVGIESVGAAGTRSNSTIRSVRGVVDPNIPDSQRGDLADARAVADLDHGVIFVGWSRFDGPRRWKAGVDVVSIASERVVGQIDLPLSVPMADLGTYVRAAPTVSVSPSASSVLITDYWYTLDGQVTGLTGAQTWTGSFEGTTIAGLRAGGETTGCDVASSGPIDDTTSYVLCWEPTGGLSLFRFDANGKPIDYDPAKPSDVESALDGLSQVARSGDHLYLWQPMGHTLIDFDLKTGDHRIATASTTAAAPSSDPLAGLGRAIGRWLAPSALAKILVEPGLVVSPDGKTAYALGITGVEATDSSLGVFVFDTSSMQQTAHWQPTADYVSLAISADGRSVYALGMPAVDAVGNSTRQGASITVFDPSNGQVVAIAGQLGSQMYLFPDPVVR